MQTLFTFIGCTIGTLFGLWLIALAYFLLFGFRDSEPKTSEYIGSLIVAILGSTLIYYSVHYAPFTIGLN